jgi:hypothetical protein
MCVGFEVLAAVTMLSSGTWRRMGHVGTDVSKEDIAPIIKGKESSRHSS